MPPGPKPVSANGKLPGRGMGKLAKQSRFATWLKLKRVRHHLNGEPITQRMMAKQIGLSYSRYVKAEGGEYIPSVEMVEKLANYFREDRDMVHLMAYHLAPDMHLWLMSTVEGEQTVRNIRKIMNRVGPGTLKPYVNLKEAKQDQSRVGRGIFAHRIQREEEEDERARMMAPERTEE